jgi:hypothetical protein
MTPFEAAFENLHLQATKGTAAAVQFAMQYENDATTEDYAEYLDILENNLSNFEAAA